MGDEQELSIVCRYGGSTPLKGDRY